MGRIGIPELLLIFFILLLVFGANRLPELGRGLGKAIRGFKDATNSKDEGDDLTPPHPKG
jgi:sec-independent protein translocase protein TatA